MSVDLLPDSRMRSPTGVVRALGVSWVPVFCGNCGAKGGLVRQDDLDLPGMQFCSWLCRKCEHHGGILGTLALPDQAWWRRASDAMMEEFGRVLAPGEQAVALQDPSHVLSRIARERAQALRHGSMLLPKR